MSITPWQSLSLRSRTTFLGTVGVLLSAGAVVIVIALHIRATTRPVTDGILTRGVVEGSREYSGRGTTYRDVIVFKVHGRPRSFLGPIVQDRPKMGTTVSVSYDPADPADAHEVTSAGDYIPPLALGIALTVVALLLAAMRPVRAFFSR